MWETRVQSLGWEDPLEKEMATHSSTLAWKVSWMGNLVGYSPWGRKESDTTERLHYYYYYYGQWLYLFPKNCCVCPPTSPPSLSCCTFLPFTFRFPWWLRRGLA